MHFVDVVEKEAVRMAEQAGSASQLAHARRTLGRVLVDRGELRAARKLVDQARETFESLQDVEGLIACEQTRWGIARQEGDLETAGEIAEEMRSIQEIRGNRWGLALAMDSLGEVARYRGDLDEAVRCYQEASVLFRSVSVGASRAHITSVNLGLALLGLERFEEAEKLLHASSDILDRTSSMALAGLIQAVLAGCAAGRGDWPEFDACFARANVILEPLAMVDVDLATLAMQAGRDALRDGETSRARLALKRARDQWESLGRRAEASEARRLLALASSGVTTTLT